MVDVVTSFHTNLSDIWLTSCTYTSHSNTLDVKPHKTISGSRNAYLLIQIQIDFIAALLQLAVNGLSRIVNVIKSVNINCELEYCDD